MASLFDIAENEEAAPLADRLRPAALEEVVGQSHVLGEDGVLARMIASGHYLSLIFWGPPGCGKTTLARLIAKESGYH
ncbi:MAG: AAA family ATPase, partial [Alphaproteobacteria bacterium]|nr:AAA family ATPase [Alphaproteobacteria bacterium]